MSSATTQTVKGACGIAPETQSGVVSGVHPVDHKSTAHTVLTKVAALWEPGTTITYSFFGGTKNQQDAVDRVAPEWTWYAKLNLQREDDSDIDAMIRIAFDPKAGSWSSVGKGALNVKDGGITMNLGRIEDSPTVSDNDRGTILHEWGHALGLMHEHQSPTRGGTITLKTDEIFEYYRLTQGWDDALIQSEIFNVYHVDDMSNYGKLDTHSIMMYFMPGSLNVQNITVNINNRLTDMDKAYMVINYPRTVQYPKAPEWTLEKALDVAGVPATEQNDILSYRDNILSLRAYFASWNKETRANEYEASPAPRPVPSQLIPASGDDEVSRLLKELLSQMNTPQSHAPDDPFAAQHGLFPLSTVLGAVTVIVAAIDIGCTAVDVVNTVVDVVKNVPALKGTQHGLYSNGVTVLPPEMNAPFYPKVNELAPNAIWNEVTRLLHGQLLQNILGSVVDVLKQNTSNPAAASFPPGIGINPQGAANGTQHGLYFNGGAFVPPPPPLPGFYTNVLPPPPPPPFSHYGLYSNNAAAVPPGFAEQLNRLVSLGGLDTSSYSGKSPIVPAVDLSANGSACTPSKARNPVSAVFAGDLDVPAPPGVKGGSPL